MIIILYFTVREFRHAQKRLRTADGHRTKSKKKKKKNRNNLSTINRGRPSQQLRQSRRVVIAGVDQLRYLCNIIIRYYVKRIITCLYVIYILLCAETRSVKRISGKRFREGTSKRPPARSILFKYGYNRARYYTAPTGDVRVLR